jgi:hypothetical protein
MLYSDINKKHMIKIIEEFQLHYYELKNLKDSIDRDIALAKEVIRDEVDEIKLLDITDKERLDWVGQANNALIALAIIRDDISERMNKRKYQLN